MLWLDHVVFAVADLGEAAEAWRRDHGLDSVEGGRHEGWGTANRIVPLGGRYLELIAAVDPELARTTAFGRSVLERAGSGGGWLMPVLATDDIDAVARRLDLEVAPGERTRPDGETLRWRSAGFEDPRREPWMPFFIRWDVPDELHPGRARAGHGVRAAAIASVELGGGRDRLDAWLGGAVIGLEPTGGADGVAAVTIVTADGELRIAGGPAT